jgi:hypothetical protein
MRHDLVNAYVPSCAECQRNKSHTTEPPGPLHPLNVPSERFESVAIDFIGPLPRDNGFDEIVMMTDRMGADFQLAPCRTDITAEEFARIFFNKWYCKNRCLHKLITDRDKLFVSKFWKALMQLVGINHKLSTVYHPQTDGVSECTNKMVVQCLRYHVDWRQAGWVKSLPKVRFDIMNMVNASTGFSPFNLKLDHSPRIIPLLLQGNGVPHIIVTPPNMTPEEAAAYAIIEHLEIDIQEARDSLMAAKISQSHYANINYDPNPTFKVGDKVMLAMKNRQREYMQGKSGCVAKFMPRFDGPYEITAVYPASSNFSFQTTEATKLLPFTCHISRYTKPMMMFNSFKWPWNDLGLL